MLKTLLARAAFRNGGLPVPDATQEEPVPAEVVADPVADERPVARIYAVRVGETSPIVCTSTSKLSVAGRYLLKVHWIDNATRRYLAADRDSQPPSFLAPQLTRVQQIERDSYRLRWDEDLLFDAVEDDLARCEAGTTLLVELLELESAACVESGMRLVAVARYTPPSPDAAAGSPWVNLQFYSPPLKLPFRRASSSEAFPAAPAAFELAARAKKPHDVTLAIQIAQVDRPEPVRVLRRPETDFEIEAPRFTYEQLAATLRLSKKRIAPTSSVNLLRNSVLNLAAPDVTTTRRDPLLPCRLPTVPRQRVAIERQCTAVAFSTNGLYLACAVHTASTLLGAAAGQHVIRVYELANMDRVEIELVGHQDVINQLAWSADSSELYSVSSDCSMMVWNFADSTTVRTILIHPCAVNVLAVRPDVGQDSRQILTGGKDGILRRWSLPATASSKPRERATVHVAPIVEVSWDRDGRRVFSADALGNVVIWAFSGLGGGNASGAESMVQSPSVASEFSPGLSNSNGLTRATQSVLAVGARLECLKVLEGVMEGAVLLVATLSKSKRIVVVGRRRIVMFDYLYRKLQEFSVPGRASVACRPCVSICTSHVLLPLDDGSIWVLTTLGLRTSTRTAFLTFDTGEPGRATAIAFHPVRDVIALATVADAVIVEAASPAAPAQAPPSP
ncbi:Jouberin [Blastocladiella emersonii ATCC 22665]|nr:Jouberin [Blastocladiella emersonii ATCC 22665]